MLVNSRSGSPSETVSVSVGAAQAGSASIIESPLAPATKGTQPLKLIFPPPSLCTDNGVMVAWCGVEKLLLGISDAVSNQEVIARWPLGSPIEEGKAVFRKRKSETAKASRL